VLDFLLNPLFWGVVAISLIVLELFAPGHVFVGLAGGAGIATLVAFFLGGALRDTPAGFAVILIIFATAALIQWFLLRKFLGVREGQSKTFDRDING